MSREIKEEAERIINLDDFCCNVLECKQSIVWDCGEGICTSCKLVGQSYTINKYPKNCEHLQQVKEYIKTHH